MRATVALSGPPRTQNSQQRAGIPSGLLGITWLLCIGAGPVSSSDGIFPQGQEQKGRPGFPGRQPAASMTSVSSAAGCRLSSNDCVTRSVVRSPQWRLCSVRYMVRGHESKKAKEYEGFSSTPGERFFLQGCRSLDRRNRERARFWDFGPGGANRLRFKIEQRGGRPFISTSVTRPHNTATVTRAASINAATQVLKSWCPRQDLLLSNTLHRNGPERPWKIQFLSL